MKNFAVAFSALFMILTSCSSDESSSSTTDPNEILPQKVVTQSTSGDYTDNFFYNGKKITKIESDDGQETVFTYTGNLITKVETFFDDELDETELYAYDSTGKLISYTVNNVTFPSFNSNETYVHNTNGTISFSNFDNGVLYSTGTFTFVGNDILNVVSNYVGISITSTNSYAYDTKLSPFKNIEGYKWYLIAGSENSSNGVDHNVLTFTDSETPSNGFTNVYTYNSLNFPNTVSVDGETSTFTYN